MKHILIILIFFCTVTFQGQNSSESSKEYILKGKAISDLDKGADCGYFKFATVVEFKIIHFSDKTYKNNRIAIAVPCPEFYGSNFFKKGIAYVLKIKILDENTSKKDFDYSVQNMKTLEKYKNDKIYWPTSIKKNK